MTGTRTQPDRAPTGTAMVHLATFSVNPRDEASDRVVGVLRHETGLGTVASWYGRSLKDGGFSCNGLYLRGPDEPYRECPQIAAVFVLSLGHATRGPRGRTWAPTSQYAFVDRESAESHAAWMAEHYGWFGIEVRELPLDAPLVDSL